MQLPDENLGVTQQQVLHLHKDTEAAPDVGYLVLKRDLWGLHFGAIHRTESP